MPKTKEKCQPLFPRKYWEATRQTGRMKRDRCTPHANAASPNEGAVKPMTIILLKVTLTVVVTIVFLDDFLPELPEDFPDL